MNLAEENLKKITCELTEDQIIEIETGQLAMHAASSVLMKQGDTRVLVTCAYAQEPKEGIDFFPLTVDYEERMYSVGEIPSSYNRREGRPSDNAILTCRLIDRPLRPLFPKGFHNDVQVVATVLSADRENPADQLCIMGASLAVGLAGLPINRLIGGVRVGLIDDKLILNPTYQQLEESKLDLFVAGNSENVMMVEAGASFVSEDVLIAGISFAHEYIKKQIDTQEKLLEEVQVEKINHAPPEDNKELREQVEKLAQEKLIIALESACTNKDDRDKLSKEAYAEVEDYYDNLPEDSEERELKKQALAYTKDLEKSLMRGQIMNKGLRVDGRKCNEIRPIWCKTSFLPRTHGSGVFTRGTTQVLSVATLGGLGDAKRVDDLTPTEELRYFHNYNFPPYSVGEARPMRSPGRREIGHGALAERAIIPTLPTLDEFPYVIRVVSDVISSNGSTSMASTCGSCLALMDAGVPIKSVVGGIAMGLIIEDGQCAILSDIQGLEDFLGDMDFKVTGDKSGVTALQLDLKLPDGVPVQVLKAALAQAYDGRVHIIEKMEEEISAPRAELSKHAPQVTSFNINPDDIGTVIGSGGKTIKALIEEFEVEKIDIDDDGKVIILGPSENGLRAQEKIENMLMTFEPGGEYAGVVVRRMEIGILVELAPGKSGMMKTGGGDGFRGRGRGRGGPRGRGRDDRRRRDDQPQEQTPEQKEQADKYKDFNVGDKVTVVVKEIDPRGRINLESMEKISE